MLRLVLVQFLIGITDHGITSPGSPASHAKPVSGASLVQKRSRMEKRSEDIFDEDDEGHNMHQVADSAINVQLRPEGTNVTKGADHALTGDAGEAANMTSNNPKGRDQKRSSIDSGKLQNVTTGKLQNVTIHGNGLTISTVGNLENPNLKASGARHGPTNSSEHSNTSSNTSKWPSWLKVAVMRGSKMLDAACGRVVKLLVQKHWVSDAAGDEPEGSLMLVGFGIAIAITLFVAFMCVHQIASRQASKEEVEDSSTSWFRHLDESSPFSSPNRHSFLFRCLGFGWTSRFSAQPMPLYSVRSEKIWIQ